MLRVIAGKFGRIQLDVPPGDTTRPITDRVKESIFNILGSRFGMPGELPEFDVLDVFAGSGSFGIESLSRGARRCTFVEQSRQAARTLSGNIARLKPPPETAVVVANAWTMRLPEHARGFGLIFVDPPYKDVANNLLVCDLLMRLATRLADIGLLMLRHESRTPFNPAAVDGLEVADERRIGHMRLIFFRRPGRGEVDGALSTERSPSTE